MLVFYWFLLAILLGTYGSALTRVKRNSNGLTPLLGWLVGLGFFMIAPLTVLTLNGGFQQPAVYDVNGSWDEINLSNWIFFRPYLIVWLGLMLALSPVFLLSPDCKTKGDGGAGVISCRKLEHVLLTCMALMVTEWVATIGLAGGIPEFLMSHWYIRNEDLADRWGRSYLLFTHLSLTNQMIFTGAAAFYTSLGLKNQKTRWVFSLLMLAFFLTQIVISGNRIFFALYLLAFGTSCWLYRRWKIMAVMLLATPLLIFVFSAWSSVRAHVGDLSDSLTNNLPELDLSKAAMTHSMNATEGMSIMLLMHMINDFGTKYPYLHGDTYARIVTFFLPASLVPNRPPDFSTLSAQLYQPGDVTSLGSTALGEAYANFALPGILVLPLLTWFSMRWSDGLRGGGGKGGLLSAISFVMFVCFVRFPFAENAMILTAAVLAVWGLGLERPCQVRWIKR